MVEIFDYIAKIHIEESQEKRTIEANNIKRLADWHNIPAKAPRDLGESFFFPPLTKKTVF